MLRPSPLILTLCMIIVLLSAALLREGLHDAPSADEPSSSASTVKDHEWLMMVEAADDWQSTGIDVASGEWLVINYQAGKWTTDPSTPHFEPNGGGSLTCTGEDCIEPLPGKPKGSLVGRIGVDGETFWVGNHFEGKISSDGRLYLSINDPDTYDNSGEVMMQISLHPSPPER